MASASRLTPFQCSHALKYGVEDAILSTFLVDGDVSRLDIRCCIASQPKLSDALSTSGNVLGIAESRAAQSYLSLDIDQT